MRLLNFIILNRNMFIYINIIFLIIIDICCAHEAVKKETDLKISNKNNTSTLEKIASAYVDTMKLVTVINCAQNAPHLNESVKEVIKDLEKCIDKKFLLLDSREDYLDNVEKCSKVPLETTKSCLRKEQRYYPDFLLNLGIAHVNFIYDNKEIITDYLEPCIKVFDKAEVTASILLCLMNVGKNLDDAPILPFNVEIFCQKYMPTFHCLTDAVVRECSGFEKLDKYSQDHILAVNYACLQKYED